MKYVAFLRGINVGNKQLKMEVLRSVLAEMGLSNVKTLLASGNIIFETQEENHDRLGHNVTQVLRQKFGFEIPIIIYTVENLQKIALKSPFRKITADKNTRLYMTFSPQPFESSIKLPYKSPDKNFHIIDISDKVVSSVVHLTSNTGTLDLMDFLDKKFGKNITTRNWNTIEKLLKL